MEEELFKKQVAAELKNAQKSEERKKNQKRKISEESKADLPNSKKPKKGNSIPLTQSDILAIRQFFWTSVDYNPLLKRIGLRSGLSNEVMYFAAYPILLGPPAREGGRSVATEYILGVTRPQYVLGGLRKVFEMQYPERNPVDFSLWEVFKWNRAYHGVKAEKVSYNTDLFEYQCVETKPFGGPRDQTTVHWSEEFKLGRWSKAISIADYFKDKDPNKMLPPPIPKDAAPWPSDYLSKIHIKVEELKKALTKAENTATEKLNHKEIKDAMEKLEDESEEDSDDQ